MSRWLCCVLAVLPVTADVITTDPNLPPNVGGYVSGNQQTCFVSCSNIDLTQLMLTGFSNIVRTANAANEIESFSAVAAGLASIAGGAFTPVMLSGTGQMVAFSKIGNPTGTFLTELTMLNLGGGGVMLRESPTLTSSGGATITDVGGGNFQIHSFFDIFVDLSIDGGTTWIPSTGPTHKDLTNLPEPATLLLTEAGLAIVLVSRPRQS